MAHPEFESIVRDALACAARAEPGDVVTWPCAAWSARPAVRLRPRNTFRLHDHPVPELCIAVRGRAAMRLADRWFAFEPPAFAVIDPQVMHTEGWRSSRSAYTLLWMGLSHASLLGHASVYEPTRGQHCGGRVWIHSSVARELGDLFAHGRIDSRERWAQLRSVVLHALGEMHHELLREAGAGETEANVLAEPRDAVIRWLREFLDEHYAESIDLKTLSALTGYTPNYLNTVFHEAVGRPVRAYLTQRRLERAWELCRRSDEPIQAIARRVGYGDPLYFTRAFRRFHGVSPTEARAARQPQPNRRHPVSKAARA